MKVLGAISAQLFRVIDYIRAVTDNKIFMDRGRHEERSPKRYLNNFEYSLIIPHLGDLFTPQGTIE